MSADYAAFLAAKSKVDAPTGMHAVPNLHPALKPFQRDIVAWALRRGRAALFEGTGLGKTLQQLAWARAVADHTQGEILVYTPLAVAQQTIAEAAKFGIDGLSYAPDGEHIESQIAVTNYDRLDHFDCGRFAGIVLDESSILKAVDGKTRKALISACASVPWKLACTATPAPNDFTELGNHAEFLGVMTHKEMLSMYFVHDGSVRAHGAAEWRLKRHAEREFWRWLASWAVVIRSPADLGYDDAEYRLPPLHKHQVTVTIDERPIAGKLFKAEARTLSERIAARRDTVAERAAAAAAIVNAQPDRPWLVWCGLNDEADAFRALVPEAVEVRGPDDPEVKASRLLGFATGRPRVLLSKPSIAGWGMNWQHCADMVFIGLNDSFEQLFQAIRRCWRFGQTRPVNAYLIASSLEGAVVANLDAKERDFERMGEAMAEHMRDLTQREVRGGRRATIDYLPQKHMELPTWIAA